MIVKEGLTFDDVLLIPQHSEIESRSNIDTSVDFGKGVKLDIPFISANMKTVTGSDMAYTVTFNGGMAILHRFDSIDGQVKRYKRAVHHNSPRSQPTREPRTGVSVGVNSKEDTHALLSETGAKVACVDVAHGDHRLAIEMTEYIAKNFPDVLLISGNVATGAGARRLSDAGADVVKVGVGPGSLCTTRVETGNGVPQLTALEEAYSFLQRTDTKIIADGGIKAAGDIVKALCFSHAVMLGSLLAGTSAAPGQTVEINGKMYKEYAGSSTHKANHIEGVSGLVPYKGDTKTVMTKLSEGLRSGLSYQGCESLEQLRDNPVFVKLTPAALKESHPHATLIKG